MADCHINSHHLIHLGDILPKHRTPYSQVSNEDIMIIKSTLNDSKLILYTF